MNTLHMQTWRHHHPGIEALLWGGYNQISFWAAVFMTISGIYRRLAHRSWFSNGPTVTEKTYRLTPRVQRPRVSWEFI